MTYSLTRINSLYKEGEFQRDLFHYQLYRKSLAEVCDFLQVDSFVDIGCANGCLLADMKKHYPHLDLLGIDYFEWAQQHASSQIRDKILIRDLRLPLNLDKAYDVCNCTEVAEHIDREAEDVFLHNLKSLTRDVLILSWSAGANPQHLNPRDSVYVLSRLAELGFELDERRTQALRTSLRNGVSRYGYQWWGEEVWVFIHRRVPIHSKYYIMATDTDNEGELTQFRSPHLVSQDFESSFADLKAQIRFWVAEGQPRSLIRFGDGDIYFLCKISTGSAAVGRRAITVPYSTIPIEEFRKSLWENDIISVSPETDYVGRAKKYYLQAILKHMIARDILRKRRFPQMSTIKRPIRELIDLYRKHFVPHSCVYSLVSSRWIFRAFGETIALIGNERKLDLIKQLLEYEDYQNYLGISSFSDYIPVPQKGAADDLHGLEERIARRLADSTARIFLVGIGHVKTGLLSRVKHYSNAVFIDVGVGIDAIAGCVCHIRPYMARWTNYRIEGYDYNSIDQMDYNSPAYDKARYSTVWLEPK